MQKQETSTHTEINFFFQNTKTSSRVSFQAISPFSCSSVFVEKLCAAGRYLARIVASRVIEVSGMKLSKSSKKVSWAPDDNLCQAKLFRLKDCPSQVSLKARDGLLAKKSWISHSDGLDTNGLPHGLKDITGENQLNMEVSHIPKIKWKCPPKFVLSSNWLIASGEESQEAEAQKLREKQAVEVVYPLMSAIPPSPSVSLEIEECHQDDCDISLVPITSLEDEGTVDMSFDTSIISKPPALSQVLLASGNPHTSQYNSPVLEPAATEKPALGLPLGVGADIIAAATAAITVVMKCKEQGSLIVTDLLIKILTNQKMTEKLINNCRAAGDAVTIPLPESKQVNPLVPVPCTPANDQPKRMQPSPDSRFPQEEDTCPVTRSNQVAYQVPLPQANGNICPLPSDNGPAQSSNPVRPEIGISRINPGTLPKPESSMYRPPNESLTDLILRPPQPGTVQLSRSKPANGNMHSLVDEVLTALNSRPATVPVSVSKPPNLPIPVLPSAGVDLVPSHKVGNENFCPLRSVSRSTIIKVHSREPEVTLPGFNPAPLSFRPAIKGPRVLSPRPTNGNLNNILKRVQPTLNTTASFKVKSVVKNANYYKSLVKQHGGEKQGTRDQINTRYGHRANYLKGMELIHNFKPTELEPKSHKSCIFYNSPAGCRNGCNCPYQHDTSSQLRGGSMLEDKRVKRIKLDDKITGRK